MCVKRLEFHIQHNENTAPAERNQDFLALPLHISDVAFELCCIESGRSIEPEAAFRSAVIRRGESYDDDIPLRRDLAQGKVGTRGSVTGPVADQLMTILRSSPGYWVTKVYTPRALRKTSRQLNSYYARPTNRGGVRR